MSDNTDRVRPRRLGHIALRVRDLEKAVEFYTDVVGMDVRSRYEGHAAFLGIRTDASHELALFSLPADAEGPDPTRVGMYHIAFEMESYAALEVVHQGLIEKGARIVGYSDSQRSANVMFQDTEGNELEYIWEPQPDELERLRAQSGWTMPKLEPAPLAV